MTSKIQLRKEIEVRRTALDPDWLCNASARIVANLLALAPFRRAKTIALYKAIGGEVALESLFPACWEQGKRTCIPTYNPAAGHYAMAEITAETVFNSGKFGIQEPVNPAIIPISEIDLMLVPGVAFDRSGNRLGRGGGYYDRLLDGFSGFSVAAAFGFQIVPAVPVVPHDRKIDAIATETGIVEVHNER